MKNALCLLAFSLVFVFSCEKEELNEVETASIIDREFIEEGKVLIAEGNDATDLYQIIFNSYQQKDNKEKLSLASFNELMDLSDAVGKKGNYSLLVTGGVMGEEAIPYFERGLNNLLNVTDYETLLAENQSLINDLSNAVNVTAADKNNIIEMLEVYNQVYYYYGVDASKSPWFCPFGILLAGGGGLTGNAPAVIAGGLLIYNYC